MVARVIGRLSRTERTGGVEEAERGEIECIDIRGDGAHRVVGRDIDLHARRQQHRLLRRQSALLAPPDVSDGSVK